MATTARLLSRPTHRSPRLLDILQRRSRVVNRSRRRRYLTRTSFDLHAPRVDATSTATRHAPAESLSPGLARACPGGETAKAQPSYFDRRRSRARHGNVTASRARSQTSPRSDVFFASYPNSTSSAHRQRGSQRPLSGARVVLLDEVAGASPAAGALLSGGDGTRDGAVRISVRVAPPRYARATWTCACRTNT